MKGNRSLSLILAAALQVMPMLRQVLPLQVPPWASSAWAVIFRIGAGGMAMFGYHAISSASNIVPNGYTYQLKVGVATNLTIAYSGGYVPNGWSANPNPVCPGISLVSSGATGKFTGTPSVAGTYTAVATAWEYANLSGNTESATFIFVVAGPGPPPVVTNIVISPGPSVAPGTTVTLTPTVGGTGPFTYRWYFNDTPVFGGTNATLSLTNVQSSNAGAYTLSAKSIAGIGSRSTNLAVNGSPAITVQPRNQNVSPGDTAELSVTAAGAATLAYQWRMSGSNLPGRTSPTLTLSNVQSANAGLYSVFVSNSLGSVSSIDAYMRLSTSSITTTTLVFGLSSLWRYNTNGLELGTLWREFDYNDASWPSGPGILGKEDPGNPVVYPLINTMFPSTSAGTRYITNYYFRTHFTLTNMALLTGLYVSNVFDDAGIIYLNGTEVSRSTNLTTGPVTANTWALVPVQEGIFTTVNIPPAAALQGDNVISVEVHQAGTNTSTDVVMGLALFATLTNAQTFPLILTNPVSRAASPGAAVSFAASADGTAPLTYLWLKDGVPIPGSRSATYSLSSAQSSDAGSYALVASNAFGAATSQVATLTINEISAPAITTQPPDQIVPADSNVTFTVVAARAGTYQWRFNSNAIAGALGPTLTLGNAAPWHSGFYSVAISNNIGGVLSRDARLLVVPPPAAETAPRLIWSSGGLQLGLSFTSTPGYRYLVQSSPVVDGGAWTTVTNVAPAFNSAAIAFPLSFNQATQQFFRVLVTP